MLVSVAVIGAAGACAVVASYVMWRVTSKSGLWSLIAAGILAIVAFFAAVAIGVLLTNAWFRDLR